MFFCTFLNPSLSDNFVYGSKNIFVRIVCAEWWQGRAGCSEHLIDIRHLVIRRRRRRRMTHGWRTGGGESRTLGVA